MSDTVTEKSLSSQPVARQAIAEVLTGVLRGDDGLVDNVSSVETCGPTALVWVRQYSAETVDLLNRRRPSLVICDAETAHHLQVPHVVCDNPRLAVIQALTAFFVSPPAPCVHPTAVIHPSAVIGNAAAIGPHVVIAAGVRMGSHCRIESGVSIEEGVILGDRCRIKSNAVIGGVGFGFERGPDSAPLHFPHVGNVILGDDVWIGACSTIERGTLESTILRANVKVDDLVQIGHNTVTGENTLIMAGAVLCGGATVGKKCWIAPHTLIKEKVRVGDCVTTGLGAVVIRDVANGCVVAGVPARVLGAKRQL
jgi:UDP-3-O-[3-hydroxymyristoyl] glucosamine N-acyltransferase